MEGQGSVTSNLNLIFFSYVLKKHFYANKIVCDKKKSNTEDTKENTEGPSWAWGSRGSDIAGLKDFF